MDAKGQQTQPVALATLAPLCKVTRPTGVARGVFDDDDDDDNDDSNNGISASSHDNKGSSTAAATVQPGDTTNKRAHEPATAQTQQASAVVNEAARARVQANAQQASPQQSSVVAEALARAHALAQQLRANAAAAEPPAKKGRWDEKAGSAAAATAVVTRSVSPASSAPQPGMVKVGKVWMFPEDEDTSQGTFEHRRRAQEMKETEERARLLTTASQQKRAHHLADFLPKDELDKFVRRTEAARTGQPLADETFAQHKLSSSNVGFQMLRNAGWQEGTGLGASNTGTVAPVNIAANTDRAGLGQTKPDAPEQEDSEFDSYRKRMMTAYKYRPNPLNNPRRQYY